jgi:hypothetical protein
VPVNTELGNDLLIQPLLVVFESQEQVGALLDGELKNADEVCSASAGANTPSSSSVLSRDFWTARAYDSLLSKVHWAEPDPERRRILDDAVWRNARDPWCSYSH